MHGTPWGLHGPGDLTRSTCEMGHHVGLHRPGGLTRSMCDAWDTVGSAWARGSDKEHV